MADKRSPRDSKPVPVEDETTDEDLHDFNPVEEDIVEPGIVPPEGYELAEIENFGDLDSEMQEFERDLEMSIRSAPSTPTAVPGIPARP
jgi:hypothetical protein